MFHLIWGVRRFRLLSSICEVGFIRLYITFEKLIYFTQKNNTSVSEGGKYCLLKTEVDFIVIRLPLNIILYNQ